jgi:hypothetical protein
VAKKAETIDMQAMSAAIAGFLACHVLTCKFLVQEGVIDRERFLAFLEGAMSEMSTGLDDPRSLFGLSQMIKALRTAPSDAPMQ